MEAPVSLRVAPAVHRIQVRYIAAMHVRVSRPSLPAGPRLHARTIGATSREEDEEEKREKENDLTNNKAIRTL